MSVTTNRRKPPRSQLDKSKYLSDQEFERLHKRMQSYLTVPSTKRDAVLILTALYTGARASELLAIRRKDLDPEEQSVHIRGLKGSNNRDVPVPAWLFEELLTLSGPKGRPFDITYPRLAQVWHARRTTQKKFHALRHTFAIRLYRRSKDYRLVQLALGHRQVANTLIYTEYVQSKDEMRRILET